MSNTRKIPSSHPGIPHFAQVDPGASPPKYQPPPRPPGILKPFPSRIRPDRAIYRIEDDPKRRGPPRPENDVERKPCFPNPPKYPAPPPVARTGANKPAADAETGGPETNRAEMLKFVRVNKQEHESDKVTDPTAERNREACDPDRQTRRIQSYANEIRALKEANQRLGDDNQELRDLCCFLDDDRQKGRKLAREWQRFGRYTASVMRQEVSAYQNKLRQLENKQQELIKDNLELKELCLYLDEERNQPSSCPSCGAGLSTRPGHRDDGDGSSSSTNADEPGGSSYHAPRRTESRERLLEESIQRQRNVFNEQIIQYVRYLERRVKNLEGDRQILVRKLLQSGVREEDVQVGAVWAAPEEDASGRPEAVVRALQVLEVRESVERSNGEDAPVGPAEPPSEMGEREKALVMEMCNVVWRKLEEGPAAR